MSAIDYLLLAAIAGWATLALRHMHRAKKSGCGGCAGCGQCGKSGSCGKEKTGGSCRR